jgi:hypothetical protein
LEDLREDASSLLSYCKYSCGKSFHTKCFQMCANASVKTKCAFCRHPLNYQSPKHSLK